MERTLDAARRPGHWALVLTLAVALVAAGYFINSNVVHYLAVDPQALGEDFWSRRFGLWPHLAGGTIAVTCGLAQLWLGATGRTATLHRQLGRIYLVAVAVGCLGGYYLACTAVNPPGWTYRCGLFGLTLAWTVTTLLAWLAIRRRRFDMHRDWMIRSYVVTFAFVTFRLLDRVLEAAGFGPDAERANLLIWLCWSIPLLVTGAVLEYRRLGARHG